MDLYIETPTFCFFIENKIGAGEQEDQIYRYANYCKIHNKKYLALYLTKFGSESTQSGDEKYYTISYNSTILNWLKKNIDATNKFKNIECGLTFYDDLIRNRILKISTLKTMVEIIELLKQEKNLPLIKHWSEIENSMHKLIDELKTQFFDRIIRGFREKYKIDTSQPYIIRFIAEQFVFKSKFGEIWAEIRFLQSGLYYRIYLSNYYAMVKSESVIKMKEIMQSKLDLLYDDDDDNCILWQWLIEKSDEQICYDIATKKEISIEPFYEKIDNYLTIWQETIKYLNEQKIEN
jgi:hypothetical protein